MTSLERVVQKYRALNCGHLAARLAEVLSQAEANALSYLQVVEQLVELELQGRERKRLQDNLRKAGFPVIKRLEEFDYRHQTTITKRQVNQLLDFRFLEERTNLVFIGPPGVGKTHLAIGLGLKAIEAGYKVLFTTALALVETLELAELKGELKKKIASLLKFDLLIIDLC
jgi:DNA replication protein DnaC